MILYHVIYIYSHIYHIHDNANALLRKQRQYNRNLDPSSVKFPLSCCWMESTKLPKQHGCPPKLDSKIWLLKIPHILVIALKEFSWTWPGSLPLGTSSHTYCKVLYKLQKREPNSSPTQLWCLHTTMAWLEISPVVHSGTIILGVTDLRPT